MASETMASDPPPVGPSYDVKLWVPPVFPAELSKLDEKEMQGLAIQSTYCLVGRKRPRCRPPADPRRAVTDVQVLDFVFSYRRSQGAAARASWTPVLQWKPLEGGWKKTYRTSKPEAKELKHKALLGRLGAQQEFRVGSQAWRHEPAVAHIIEKERQLAKQRRKAQRIRLREEHTEESSSDFSSDSASTGGSGQDIRKVQRVILTIPKSYQSHTKIINKSTWAIPPPEGQKITVQIWGNQPRLQALQVFRNIHFLFF